MRANSHLLSYCALLFVSFSWGSSFVALKYAVGVLDPYQVIFLRMSIASVAFIILWRYWRNISYRAGDWRWLGLMAIAEPCLFFMLEAHALKYTSASAASILNTLLPPMVAAAAWLFLREQLTRYTRIGILLALTGGIWLSLTTPSDRHAPAPILGNFLEFCAMLASCLYIIVLRKISDRYSALFLTALQVMIGAVFFFPLALIAPWPTQWPSLLVFSLIYLGIAVSFGGYFLYNWGVARIGATRATVFVNFVPLNAVLLSNWLLDERLQIAQIGAALLIISGVVCSQWRHPSPVPTKAQDEQKLVAKSL